MPIPVKSSGPISFSEISAGVSSAGGTASTSFANLSRQAYAITGESRFLIPDKFTDFEYVTTTTTTSTTTTTTTTTTLPPLTITNSGVTCYGVLGSFYSTIGGGSGTYTYIAIATSQANADNAVRGISGTRYSVSSNPYLWNNVSNGTYYVAVMDSAGTVTVQGVSVTINCTTTTTTTTTAAPVYYYNATRCFDGASKIIYGGNNYYSTGTVVISGTTTYCYTIQNEVGAQAYEDTVGASVDNCNNASCYVLPTTTTTTLPPLSMTISQDCVSYLGTGFINITGVSNGSGNYVYHIGGLIDFSDPNQYNLNSSASGLANGGYYVAVYDSSQLRYVVENRNINCPVEPTTTTTTAAPTTTTTTTTTTCTPDGTYLYEYCDYVNFNKIGVFADGNCGTRTEIIAYDDPTCGYVAPTTAAPTTAAPTTTTTAFPGYFYLAEKYDCATCTYQGDYIVKSDVPLSTMSYYSTDGNYSYKIMYSASPQSYDNDLTYYTYTDGASCAEACANY